MTFADYLPPVWVSRLRRMRRSVLVYKPAMLLAALDLIEEGSARPDWIPLDLCARRFAELLVGIGGPTVPAARAEMPIFHLSTAHATALRVPFWRLLRNGQVRDDQAEPSSLSALLRQCDAAAFVEPLRVDLATSDGRQRVRLAIYNLLEADGNPASTTLVRAHDRSQPQIDEEVRRLKEVEHTPFRLDDSDAERVDRMTTLIVRDRALRRTVLELYGHACAFCGLRLRWGQNVEAQAAHIKPRAHLGADDVRNALALCGVHHWAFDLGLWTATDDLEVIVREPPASDQYDVRALASVRALYRLDTVSVRTDSSPT